ncbi:hypothetical protein OHA91_22840 [Streptomyces erythrochromogenes]|uniref:Uncharacterized protein n=1 Tax=Streptomyces erythrochromogenes TaxID=285574 RepID=A0ABZ1QEJ9_9ACTN|nr:hypothetical protein [Streptomyces erythrochromogenes]
MLIPASSTEYVTVTVTAQPAGVDLTGAAPRFAFLPDARRGNPTAADWLTGEWDDADTARILVGPDGASSLTRGAWHVWIEIDPPNDELIVRQAGTLTIT